MLENYSKDFRFVVQYLAKSMRLYQQKGDGVPGVVFLLGAGCSMQYGLPGFQDLLANIYIDFTGLPQEEVAKWEQQKLRDELEDLFGSWDPDTQRESIKKFSP